VAPSCRSSQIYLIGFVQRSRLVFRNQPGQIFSDTMGEIMSNHTGIQRECDEDITISISNSFVVKFERARRRDVIVQEYRPVQRFGSKKVKRWHHYVQISLEISLFSGEGIPFQSFQFPIFGVKFGSKSQVPFTETRYSVMTTSQVASIMAALQLSLYVPWPGELPSLSKAALHAIISASCNAPAVRNLSVPISSRR
jgi:hypothetical protein